MQMTRNYTFVALGTGEKEWLGSRIPRLKRDIKLELEDIKWRTVSCDLEMGLSVCLSVLNGVTDFLFHRKWGIA
jgi:hypothetical protein